MSSASLMLVKRDRLILAASLTTITLLAWAYTIYLARDMQGMDMTMPTMQSSEHGRHPVDVYHVDGDDGGHDDALGQPDGLPVCTC